MDFQERELLYNRIISEMTIVVCDGFFYYISDAMPIDNHIVEQYRKSIYDKLIMDGVKSESDMVMILKEKQLWNDDKEKQIIDLGENLKKLRKQLPSLQFKSLQKKEIEIYIDHTKKELKKLNNIRSSLLQNSAEYITRMEIYKRLIYRLTKDENGNKIWASWDIFQKTDDKLITKLVEESLFNSEITAPKIRELARSEPFTSLWAGAKISGNMFSRPMGLATNYQKLLISWAVIYSSLAECADPPSSEVINNDDLMDEWLDSQSDKRKKDTGNLSTNIPANAQEVGIMVDTPEDAQKVYKLNSGQGLNKIQARENLIKAKGVVSEVVLPDRQKELRTLANNVRKV